MQHSFINCYFTKALRRGRNIPLEAYSELYLELAAAQRRKADASADPRVRKSLMTLARAYELAAEAIRKYPEAA